jgi:hypothetical protein
MSPWNDDPQPACEGRISFVEGAAVVVFVTGAYVVAGLVLYGVLWLLGVL